MIAYPLNETDYTAADPQVFCCTRSSGVYSGDDFRVTATGADTNVTIGPGVGWMRLSKFAGIAIAEKGKETLNLGVSDPRLPRLDAVAIVYNSVTNDVSYAVRKGTPASSPALPERSTSASLYELFIAKVYRAAGSATVKSGDITDLRLDPEMCGLMADPITSIDTAAISAQVYDLIERLQVEIDAVKDGSDYLLRTGGTMQGPLDMGGNSLHNIPQPTQPGDAVPNDYLESYVKEKAPFKESAEYPGCFFRDVKGVAEWLNPPMVPGTQYRTAERYNNKPVYTMLIKKSFTGAVGNPDGYYDALLPVSIPDIGDPVSVSGTITASGGESKWILPYLSSGGGNVNIIEIAKAYIRVRIYGDQWQSPTFSVIAKFTKRGD